MTHARSLSVSVVILAAILVLLVLVWDTATPVEVVRTASQRPADSLITPEGLQQQIDAILTSHGCTGIEIDGVVGPATRAAWSKALAIQGGDEITRNFYAKENEK